MEDEHRDSNAREVGANVDTFRRFEQPRRVTLSRAGREVRVEYESYAVSLERLHRLFRWYSDPPPCESAVYVAGDAVVVTIKPVGPSRSIRRALRPSAVFSTVS